MTPHHTARPTPAPRATTARLITLAVATCAFTATGCGWGYAARTYKRPPEQRPPSHTKTILVTGKGPATAENAVVLEDPRNPKTKRPAPTRPTVARATPKPPPAAAKKDDPCPMTSFIVFRLGDSVRESQELFCLNGAIMNQTRDAISTAEYDKARMSNYPIGSWYLVVNPTAPASKPDALNNADFMALSKLYDFAYHKRMATSGHVIYILKSEQPKSP